MQDTKTTKYLKAEHYIDLYDRHTVEECRRHEKRFLEGDLWKNSKHTIPLESQKNLRELANKLTLYFITGDRYTNKSETIQRWVNQDRRKDEVFERAQPSHGISCLRCNSKMNSIDKDLYWSDDERVLFLFECNKCSKRRAFFDNGEEFDATHKCSKCGNMVQATHSRKKNKITTKYDCSHCGFKETKVLDLDEKPKETKREVVDKDFDADRKRFCLSKEEGLKYIGFKAKSDQFNKGLEEDREKEKQKDLYDEVAKVKKLNIADLEKQLLQALKKENYKKLEFSKPELGRIIVIEFTVQDASSGVHEHDRRMTLKKSINSALLSTNWKLVEDSISYRLGIISGRLRGFEYEEDIVELVKARRKKLEKKLGSKLSAAKIN